MKAWITSRRIKPGSEEVFRRRWSTVPNPEGVAAAYLLQADEDAQEILSLSLWDDPEALRRYRAALDSGDHPDLLADVADEQWNRGYAVQGSPAQPARGRRLWSLVPVSAAAAGTAGLLWRRQQQRQRTNVVVAAATHKRTWLFLPALLAPLGAAAYFLIAKLRHGDEVPEVAEEWSERMASPTPIAPLRPPTVPPSAYTPELRMAPPPQQHQRLVREAMTPHPETIEYDADLTMAAAKMRDLNVGVIPVMADGSLAGMVTDRDLALAMAEGNEALTGRKVRNVMSAVPVTVSPDTTVQAASELMAGHQVRRLPVVDGSNLLGIVSLGDLAIQGPEPDAARALEAISEPAAPQR